MPKNNIQVINLQGEKEPFSKEKVFQSAKRAGASESLAEEIAGIIADEVTNNTHTSKIYDRVKELLSKKEPQTSIKFSLKEAMRKLGPTGFPFEKFTANILEKAGYEVQINQFLSGACVDKYETDFLAQKGQKKYIGECKYHTDRGEKVDLQDALYNFARFEDIIDGDNPYQESSQSFFITNAKFSSMAIKYSRCKDVKLLGWRYPQGEGLETIVEKYDLYPITILPSVDQKVKKSFDEAKIMLAKDLSSQSEEELLRELSIPKNKLKKLIKEAKTLLK
jgi:hypothetical protein